MKRYLLLLISCLSIFSAYAQNMIIRGNIQNSKGQMLANVTVKENGRDNQVQSDHLGNFSISVDKTSNRLIFSSLGYKRKEITIEHLLKGGQEQIVLEQSDAYQLEEVDVLGKTYVNELEGFGYNVSAIDVKPYHNASVNLTDVLNKTPGVKIREEGGLGSRTNVTINGLSGKHIRFFIDGMPMDAMSSAFQVNNIPVNLVERIEVYKGIVPINFGSDALGGAINFVTKSAGGNYLDASYSYGSFNTHKTFVNAGITNPGGFTAQLSAFQNYSDNNYFVDATIKDFETNLLSKEPQRVRRFHDKFHSEGAIAKFGFLDKPFADQLLFGFTFAQTYKEIQHPAYLNLAFGEKYVTNKTIMPSILYKKSNFLVPKLDLSISANYNFGGGHNSDLSDREYNWLGQSVPSNSLGEISYSDYFFNDHNATANGNLIYRLTDKSKIVINNVSTFFDRQGDERVQTDDITNEKPRKNNRNILAAGYYVDFSDKWAASFFGKRYDYKASAFLNLSNQNGVENFQTAKTGGHKYGYGIASSYFLLKSLQLKASYELTARLPVSEELFGEVFGFYLGNFNLRPEQSNNYNLGFNYNIHFADLHTINMDVNGFHRHTNDFIRQNVSYSQGEASFVNESLVKINGFDADIRYTFKNILTTSANVSSVSPKNYDKGSTYYKAILPNLPNFFANWDATYFLNNLIQEDDRFSISYSLQFIDKILLDYSTYQSSNRAETPQQWNHSLFASYSWKNGKYNLATDCKNIADAKLYDNFSLQKPGRQFSIKFRYALK